MVFLLLLHYMLSASCSTGCPSAIQVKVGILHSYQYALLKVIPGLERWFFFVSIMRNGFVIIVLTIASWLSMRHRRNSKGNYPIKILETVPRGFQVGVSLYSFISSLYAIKNVGPPFIGTDLLSALASEIPIATVILVMEHIAISKCKYIHCHFTVHSH